jgi:hypothetical protein
MNDVEVVDVFEGVSHTVDDVEDLAFCESLAFFELLTHQVL